MAIQRSLSPRALASACALVVIAAFSAACADSDITGDPSFARGPGGGGGGTPPPPPPPGEILFFEETFGGNGRTCGTCHRKPSFKINPQQIANLSPDDVLFVGKLDITPGMIEKGLFTAVFEAATPGDPAIVVHRNVPTVFSLEGTQPFMWDARAADLVQQITGAVMFHFHDNTLDDSPTKRMPTATEIQDMSTFMLSLVPPPANGSGDSARIARGQDLFFGKAQCVACHMPPLFTDNQAHNTGVSNHPFAPTGMPFDPGVCRIDATANDCATSGSSFMTPDLIGVRHGRPYFHNNLGSNLFRVFDFYTSGVFLNSPAAQRVGITPFTLTTSEQQDLHEYLFTL